MIRQISTRRAIVLGAVAATTLGLAGCVSLFPKAKPVTLYRLAPATAAPAAPRPARPVVVQRAPTYFTRTSSNDLIITRSGLESASIAGARWATPVQIMFDEAMAASFDGNGTVNLITRGSPLPPDLSLRVEVTTFEANYVNGMGSAPTVKVSARLSYNALKDPTAAYETVVTAEAPASDNRVGPIVEAFNTATGELLGKIVSETGKRAALVKR